MPSLSFAEKKVALENALISHRFPKKYYITLSDRRQGKKFGIASNSESGGIFVHTNFFTYEEMNAYLFGFAASRNNVYKF